MKDLFYFLKDYDEGLYKTVKYEIEPNIATNVCVEKILDFFHQILKKLKIEETDIVIFENGKEELNPRLSALLNEIAFKNFLLDDVGFSNNDILLIKDLNRDANKKKHGERVFDSCSKKYKINYMDFTIDDKRDYFKLLYDLSLKIYNYHFARILPNEWDIQYFNYLNSKVLISTFSTTSFSPITNKNKQLCSCCGKEVKITDKFCNFCAQNNEYYNE